MRTLAIATAALAAVALSAGTASAQGIGCGNSLYGRGYVAPGLGLPSPYTSQFGGYSGFAPAPRSGIQLGLTFGNTGFGQPLYTGGYSSPLYRSGFNRVVPPHPSYGFGHYDYVPPHLDRHGSHYHLHPGHYDYHAPGTRSPRH